MVETLVRGCRCAASWCDLDLTFDLAIVTLTYKILSGLYLGNRKVVLGIGLKNQNRLIGNSEQSIIDYNRFSACFVRKTEYSFLPNIITVVFR